MERSYYGDLTPMCSTSLKNNTVDALMTSEYIKKIFKKLFAHLEKEISKLSELADNYSDKYKSLLSKINKFQKELDTINQELNKLKKENITKKVTTNKLKDKFNNDTKEMDEVRKKIKARGINVL
jgi:chromosome segregation ATPase